jgi:hypothetical protein
VCRLLTVKNECIGLLFERMRTLLADDVNAQDRVSRCIPSMHYTHLYPDTEAVFHALVNTGSLQSPLSLSLSLSLPPPPPKI